MQVAVIIKILVDVKPVDDDREEEFDTNDAESAADLAVHEALCFSNAIVGAPVARDAETTEVFVDGFGACEVTWPDQSGGFIDGENMELICEAES